MKCHPLREFPGYCVSLRLDDLSGEGLIRRLTGGSIGDSLDPPHGDSAGDSLLCGVVTAALNA